MAVICHIAAPLAVAIGLGAGWPVVGFASGLVLYGLSQAAQRAHRQAAVEAANIAANAFITRLGETSTPLGGQAFDVWRNGSAAGRMKCS
jgi:hypothetical protein